MNEITQIRLANWASLIKQRTESGMTVKQWCQANDVNEKSYYYYLKRLRQAALSETPVSNDEANISSGGFTRIPSAQTTSDVALRIKRGSTVIEVSGDAPDTILSFLKEVMIHAV